MSEDKTVSSGYGASQPCAVLRLTDLRMFRFGNRDEMQDAIRAMRERHIGYVPFVWNDGAKTWTMPEVHT